MPRFAPIVEIAPGSDLTGSASSWSWTDLTMQRYVHEPAGIMIQRGRPNLFSSATPDTCGLTLLNAGGRFVPRNPLGPWYGTLKRGTPLRILVQPQVNTARDAFGRTVSGGFGTADSGGAYTLAGTAADFSVSTTNGGRMTHPSANAAHVAVLVASVLRVDVKVRVRVNALSTGAAQTAGLVVRYTGSGDYKRGIIEFNTGGTMTARIVSRAGGADSLGTGVSTGLTHSASTWYWIRLSTGLSSVRMKVWTDGTTEPATWTIDGTTASLSSPVAGQFGVFSRREVGNTNASATIDFDDYSMADGPRVQFTGFVDEWPLKWNDQGMAQAFAPITASGQLRRLSRSRPLASAINRRCTSGANSSSSTVVAYWPMEDGTSATAFASGLDGGPRQAFTGATVSPGADSEVVGSDPLPTFAGTGSIRFIVPPYAASTTWAIRWLMKIPASSFTSPAQILSWIVPGGNPIMRWQLTLTGGSPDTFNLTGFNSTGTAVFSGTTVNAVDATSGAELTDGRQLYFEVDGVQNGANVDTTWMVRFQPDDGTTAIGFGQIQSTATTTGNVSLIYHDAVTGFGPGGHTIGHVLLATDTTAGASSTGVTGGAGDATDVRLSELCSDENVGNTFGDLVNGEGTTTQTMGAQRTADILAQLQEVEASELGTLYDGKQGSVHLLPRSMRQERPVDLTLDVDAGQVGWPFEPTDDDVALRNDIVVTNTSGSFAKSKDLVSIAEQGVRPLSAAVNVHVDGDLQYHADWRRHVGTAEELRFPAIVLNLTRNHAALALAWCDADIGSRIQITNVPSAELPPEDLDLIVDGYTEYISSTEWTATLNCSAAGPWQVGVYDGGKRYDCGACTTAEALDQTETGIDVAIADNCTWSHPSDFDVVIGGERMTVTAVSAAAGAGFAWTQTLTVTRSVNGVVKSHATAAAVHIADPFIWGL